MPLPSINYHRQAHAALDRSHEYMDLHTRHCLMTVMWSRHHAWIEAYCRTMATASIILALEHACQASGTSRLKPGGEVDAVRARRE
jgi:hypothetical protein